MSRKYLTFCLLPFMFVSVSAKGAVDCRVATGGITECNPYPTRLLVAKKVKYKKDDDKLIDAKILPVPARAPVKVISVIDMIEKYVKIEKPIRYEGSESRQLEALNIESPKDDNSHSLSRELELRREATLAKLQKMQDESYSKMIEESQLFPQLKPDDILKIKDLEESVKTEEIIKKVEPKLEGVYTVEKGDTLSTIAKKFCFKTSELRKINNFKKGDALKVGKKLTISMEQEMIDIIAKAEYIIQPGDNIGAIARDFNLSSSNICKYNNLKKSSMIRIGKKLILPFPYKIAQLERERKAEAKKSRMVRGIGKRKLRVTATAYSSHSSQTDKTPFLAAWNNRIRPGMKIIAVSRDMLTTYGLRNGSKVRIGGLSGYYTVRDKMNKRYRKRIDIYMGMNRRKALRWGKRSVVLYY